MPERSNPYRDEILSLLRRADCHYGAALRDEEAGLSIEEAARKRDGVQLDRISKLRKAVQMVADGEHSFDREQAGHEDGVLRALLHFRGEMSGALHSRIVTRLAKLQPEFGLKESTAPLRCVTRGANARRTR
ncbi:hypothetical protein ACDT10_24065 [Mycobacterium intracellulare]|uniref:hypothetical protein n=1 Tax=Mycobacterium intracellulare TaxID=1767 RepID=UPI0035590A7E